MATSGDSFNNASLMTDLRSLRHAIDSRLHNINEKLGPLAKHFSVRLDKEHFLTISRQTGEQWEKDLFIITPIEGGRVLLRAADKGIDGLYTGHVDLHHSDDPFFGELRGAINHVLNDDELKDVDPPACEARMHERHQPVTHEEDPEMARRLAEIDREFANFR